MKNQTVFTQNTNKNRVQNHWTNTAKIIITALLLFFVSITPIFSQETVSYGTGFFVSDDGLIVTCAHVLEDGSRYMVKIGNTEFAARVIAKDAQTDLAVLKIDYRNKHYFKVADFSSAKLGDKVFVLGFPLPDIFGSRIALTDGIVSAFSGINADTGFFQISAPIQPGNSGGPVFNNNFNVIGVASHGLNNVPQLIATGTVPQNVNFGAKSSNIEQILKNSNPGYGNVNSIDEAVQATVEILSYPINVTSSESSVRIVNKTGYAIHEVYIRPAGASNWGSDRLESTIIRNGHSISVKLPSSASNRFDICLVDVDNDTYTKTNVAITPDGTIEFIFEDIDLDWFSIFGL